MSSCYIVDKVEPVVEKVEEVADKVEEVKLIKLNLLLKKVKR